LIEANVKKRLGSFQLNANFKDSGIVCITGKNGSGKTTFLHLLAGFLKPDEGYVKVEGRDVTRLPPEKRGTSFVNQESYIPEKSVESHLLWGAKVRGVKVSEEEVKEVREALNINFSGKVKNLSLGQRERVAIATAILSRPKAILVDEAFSNISEKKEIVAGVIGILKKLSIEMIFTTQDASDSELADRHYVIHQGVLQKTF
jgi:molybdate/tungstate transport system ATP-binding protein